MKRILIAILTIAVFLGSMCSAYAAPAVSETYRGLQGYKIVLNSVSFKDKVPSWTYRDAVRVTALSVLKGTGDGMFHSGSGITREEAIGIALRIAGLEGDAQNAAGLSGGTMKADSWAKGYILTAADNGYISEGDIYSQNWKSKATREEFAAYIGRALDYTPAYGIDQSFASAFSDSNTINMDYMPYIESVIKNGIMAGYGNGTFGPRNGLTRGEAAAVLGRILDKYPERFNITKQSGLVYYTANNTDYTIMREDGGVFVLATDGAHGIVVLNNGSVGSQLRLNQNVDIYMKNGVPYLAEVISVSSRSAKDNEGVIKSADNNKVNIDVAGHVTGFNITQDTVITVNGKKVSANELMPGQYVSFSSRNSNLLQLAIDSQLDTPGYAQPGTFYLTGNMVGADGGILTVRDESGSLRSLTLPSYVSLNAKPGDSVKVYLDDAGNVYSVDRVTGNMQYAYLYRGKLSSVIANGIQINDTKKFDNFRWNNGEAVRLPVSDDIEVYKSNVEQGNMSDYIGSYAYFITRMEYGEEKVYRVIIETGYMKEYVEKIDRVDGVAGRISLPSTDVQINSGSILLKDGKMITADNLEEDQTVLALLDRTGGGNTAPLLMVLDRQPSVMIVKGEIDTIDSTTFDADRVYEIEGNTWSRIRDSGDFYVSDDTYILDYINNEELSPDDFLNDRYDRHPDYEGKNFYAVMDGDEVVGMVIYDPDEDDGRLANVRFVTAKIAGVENDYRVEIKDVAEYSALTDKWTVGPSLGYVWAENSLAIINGRVSSADRIKEGSSVYILVDDDMDAILIVEGGE